MLSSSTSHSYQDKIQQLMPVYILEGKKQKTYSLLLIHEKAGVDAHRGAHDRAWVDSSADRRACTSTSSEHGGVDGHRRPLLLLSVLKWRAAWRAAHARLLLLLLLGWHSVRRGTGHTSGRPSLSLTWGRTLGTSATGRLELEGIGDGGSGVACTRARDVLLRLLHWALLDGHPLHGHIGHGNDHWGRLLLLLLLLLFPLRLRGESGGSRRHHRWSARS